jgi:ubiquitin-conjugating enzyme E2 O
LNFCSFVGRFSSGFLVGPLGVWKLTVIATGAAAALIFGMVGISGVASVVVIAVLYGFFVGICKSFQRHDTHFLKG